MKKILFLVLTLVSFINISFSKTQSKGKIVFGTDPGFAPFEFYDKKNNLVGFEVDLVKALAEEAGYECEISPIAWAGIIPALETRKIDAIVGGMSITEERKKKVSFTDSYFTSGLSVVVPKNNKDIIDIKSLEGKKIAVKIATSAKEVAEKIKGKKAKEEVIIYDTNDVVYDSVITGKADAMISDTPVNDYYVITQGKGKLKTAFIHTSDDFYGIAVRKKDKQLLEDLNQALKNIKEKGIYNKISVKWFGKKLVK